MVCEGSGGFEHVLVDAMHEAGIAVCVANPRQVRGVAKEYRPKVMAISTRMTHLTLGSFAALAKTSS